MSQYIIHAFDATDADALNRRLSVRGAHFENMSKFKASGNFIFGGAILDETRRMIGSTVVMEFESETKFQEYLDSEPYIKDKVWENIKIYPFQTATALLSNN